MVKYVILCISFIVNDQTDLNQMLFSIKFQFFEFIKNTTRNILKNYVDEALTCKINWFFLCFIEKMVTNGI